MNTTLTCEDTNRICRLSGVDFLKREQHLVQLHDLAAILEQTIREARRAESDFVLWKWATRITGLVAASCDIAVAALGTKTGLVGTVVQKAYDGAKLTADAINGQVALETGVALLASNKATIIDEILKHQGHKNAAQAGIVVAVIDSTLSLAATWEASSGSLNAVGAAQRQLDVIRGKITQLTREMNACL